MWHPLKGVLARRRERQRSQIEAERQAYIEYQSMTDRELHAKLWTDHQRHLRDDNGTWD